MLPGLSKGRQVWRTSCLTQRNPTVRHLVVPTASGKYPEGKGKGNPKVVPRKRTTNLEPKLGENFTYYREHKSWRILNLCGAIAAMSLTHLRCISISVHALHQMQLRVDPQCIGDVWGYTPIASDACMQYRYIFSYRRRRRFIFFFSATK